jgi:hypothetical protein
MSTHLHVKSVTTPQPEDLAALRGPYARRVRELLEKGWGRVGEGLGQLCRDESERRAAGIRQDEAGFQVIVPARRQVLDLDPRKRGRDIKIVFVMIRISPAGGLLDLEPDVEQG